MTVALTILAAGYGTRYGGPKQLEPLGPSGETILDYSILDASRAGFGQVVLVVRPELRAAFEESVVRRWGDRARMDVVVQPPRDAPAGADAAAAGKPWGTAHAVLCAAPVVRSAFAVINGDDFYGRASISAVAAYCVEAESNTRRGNTAPEYAVVGFPLESTLHTGGAVSRALLHMDPAGFLTGIEEARARLNDKGVPVLDSDDRAISRDAPISMNMWAFTPDVFERLNDAFTRFRSSQGGDQRGGAELMLPAFVDALVRQREVKVRMLQGGGAPTGLTHPDDRAHMRDLFRRAVDRGEYPSPLWK